VLERFKTIAGVGRVYGPYVADRPWRPVYRWHCSARGDVEFAMETIRPWLGQAKRLQVDTVLGALRAQPALPRGRPDWGNRKTHCLHGHEYATARLRPYAPRGVGVMRRANSLCLVCLREYARRRRETKRSAAVPDRRSLQDRVLRYDYLLK
jgi:hypothetical protein